MKVPLEPIPTEQIVIVKQKPPKGELRAAESTRGMASMTGAFESAAKTSGDAGQLEKAYPWLLGISTCLSALLCWMYVTKPVVLQETSPSVAPAAPVVAEQIADKPDDKIAAVEPASAGLVPSDSQLPGFAEPQPPAGKLAASHDGSPVAIDPRMLNQAQRDAKESGVAASWVGWEKTNLKVQHILSADAGTGENEKIVINVPVLYQTRSMRWTPGKIKKAQDVLGRLMLYERSLSNLRKDGESIMTDWNEIIRDSVPASALRADSPSLPYNHGQGGGATDLPGSSSVIQVEE